MWVQFLEWLKENQIGDLTGLLGIAISLVGFAATVVGVLRSQHAAERAENAAKSAREIIRLFDTVVDFAAAISILEEIKRVHRQSAWSTLPDRYAAIRKLLITLRALNPDLSEDHQSAIQSAIVNLHNIEGIVERGLENPSALKAPKFNSLLSIDIDSLVQVLTQLKSLKMAGGSDEKA